MLVGSASSIVISTTWDRFAKIDLTHTIFKSGDYMPNFCVHYIRIDKPCLNIGKQALEFVLLGNT